MDGDNDVLEGRRGCVCEVTSDNLDQIRPAVFMELDVLVSSRTKICEARGNSR